MNHNYYASRAQAAYAQAEAATDPRDKAAWRGAAQTWERLASPGVEWSLEPVRREIEALKREPQPECLRCGAENARDCAENDCDEFPDTKPAPAPSTHDTRRAFTQPAVIIEF